MRRFLIPALMISLLLSGCAESGAAVQRRVEEQRERFSAAAELRYSADITANFGSEVFQCTLDCCGTPEQVTAEVIAPESVAGVRAVIRDGGADVEYGTVSLGVGAAVMEQPGPVSGAALLNEALRHGSLSRCWTETDGERELIAAETYVTDAAALTLWYDAETMMPVQAEFFRDGALILRCALRDFTIR